MRSLALLAVTVKTESYRILSVGRHHRAASGMSALRALKYAAIVEILIGGLL
jgi:hypothetical protein